MRLVLCFGALAALLAAPTHVSGGDWTEAEMLEFLRTADVIANRETPRGITKSRRLTLSDGKRTHDAHFQPIAELPRTDKVGSVTVEIMHDHYLANLAAYQLDRHLGMGLVPVTIEREIDGQVGALKWWIEGSMTEGEREERGIEPPDPEDWSRQEDLMEIFDALIGNTDRHANNIVIDEDWDAWLIDHTRAFSPDAFLHHPSLVRRCDRSILANMRRLRPTDLGERIPVELRDALFERRDQVVQILDDLIAERGEEAVLFDYVGSRTVE